MIVSSEITHPNVEDYSKEIPFYINPLKNQKLNA